MQYKKNDRVLFNRQKFGTVYKDQTSPAVVFVCFDRATNVIQSVRGEHLELVSDPQHEARLAVLINSAVLPASVKSGLAADLIGLAERLEAGILQGGKVLRNDADAVSLKLRQLAEDL